MERAREFDKIHPVIRGKIRIDSFILTVKTIKVDQLDEPLTQDNISFRIFNGLWRLPAPSRISIPRVDMALQLNEVSQCPAKNLIRLCGPIGVGKTQILYDFAKNNYQKRFETVLWFDISGDDEQFLIHQFNFLRAALDSKSLDKAFSVDESSNQDHSLDDPEDQRKTQFYQIILQEILKEGDLLIIFDDVCRYDTIKLCINAIELIESDKNITAIVATRNQSVAWNGWISMVIPPFDEKETIKYIDLFLNTQGKSDLRDHFALDKVIQYSGTSPLCLSQLLNYGSLGNPIETFDLLEDHANIYFGHSSYIVQIAEILHELSQHQYSDRLLNICALYPRSFGVPIRFLNYVYQDECDISKNQECEHSDKLGVAIDQLRRYSFIEYRGEDISLPDEIRIVAVLRMTRAVKREAISDLWFGLITYFSSLSLRTKYDKKDVLLMQTSIDIILSSSCPLSIRHVDIKTPKQTIFDSLNRLIQSMLNPRYQHSTDEFRFILWLYKKANISPCPEFIGYLYTKSKKINLKSCQDDNETLDFENVGEDAQFHKKNESFPESLANVNTPKDDNNGGACALN